VAGAGFLRDDGFAQNNNDECTTIIQTEKGIRIKETFDLIQIEGKGF